MFVLAEKQKFYPIRAAFKAIGKKEYKNMQALAHSAKLALYARQSYLAEMTRGLAFVLVADVIVSMLLKHIEKTHRQLATELVDNTNNALQQVKSAIH